MEIQMITFMFIKLYEQYTHKCINYEILTIFRSSFIFISLYSFNSINSYNNNLQQGSDGINKN